MDATVLLFWNAGPQVRLTAPEICRELTWGEEVEGLIDLPIKEIIDRLKVAFPDHEERPGLLICRTEGGSFEVTWTWQFVKVAGAELNEDDRAKLIEAVGYSPFDSQSDMP